jgi:hypothetical protein
MLKSYENNDELTKWALYSHHKGQAENCFKFEIGYKQNST